MKRMFVQHTFIQRLVAFAMAAIVLLSSSAYAFIGRHVCHEHCHETDAGVSCCVSHQAHQEYDDVIGAILDPHPHHCGCSDTGEKVSFLDTEMLLSLGQLLAPLPAQQSLFDWGEPPISTTSNVLVPFQITRSGRSILALTAVLLI